MAPTTTDSTHPLLLTQKDWPSWFQFIRREASFAKIWDYVDPDKAEDEIKKNTEPDVPSIAAIPAANAATTPATAAAAATPASTGTATPGSSSQQGQQTQQSVETQRMLFELYKLQR
jgi:hypothetical protein